MSTKIQKESVELAVGTIYLSKQQVARGPKQYLSLMPVADVSYKRITDTRDD